jgi:hypothetical protein
MGDTILRRLSESGVSVFGLSVSFAGFPDLHGCIVDFFSDKKFFDAARTPTVLMLTANVKRNNNLFPFTTLTPLFV